MSFAKITGTGIYLPDKILSNKDLESIVDTSDEWIKTRTGISERRILDEDKATSYMCIKASQDALKNANVSSKDIDGIIVATVTGDFITPSVGCILQDKLQTRNIFAFDISAGCSGFIYALKIGRSLIENGEAKKLLIVGGENLSRITDYKDRGTCVLFGDAAGAVVLEESNEPGILSVCLGSSGAEGELLFVPGGGSKDPSGYRFLKMEGKEVFKEAVKAIQANSIEAIEEAGMTPEDINLFIPHQANLRIIEAARERLNMSLDKCYVNIDKYGNTSSASVLLALHEALGESKIKKGDNILFSVFGAGFAWGSAVVRW
ncbi:MAG: beta-ketoacyl-ACP synthase III [Thermodesulfobacteriota bacterium]|nr:beta-ketoacyl-ACP synthase III [Thermodesulfobacteriota bacterium]MEE2975730.1 beta-ketoacyl-ACP synthase III [Thermodesulfobacteriota bacterium]